MQLQILQKEEEEEERNQINRNLRTKDDKCSVVHKNGSQ